MKQILLTFLCICTTTVAFAQIDNQKKTTKIAAEKSDDKKSSSIAPSLVKPIENKGLNNIDPSKVNGMSMPESSALKLSGEEFSMFSDKKFANPAELFEKNLSRQQKFTSDDEKKARNNGNTTNQYLGDFKTKSAYVKVVYRDFGEIDGDYIRVFLNDDVIVANQMLGGTYKGIKIDLQDGFNKIDFQALNQGTLGPNTAELRVYDASGKIIASNYWNLATGVKATIIVVKE